MILPIIMFALNIKLCGIVLISIIFTLIKDKNYIAMYFITFILTCLGMIFRYILEYGEVSNTRDFTIFNILITLIFMPILVMLITLLIEKAFIFTLIKDKNYIAMYFITFILTCLGMIFRYILEYGEVSNTRDFTIFNILITLIFMPILVMLITLLIEKALSIKNTK